MVMLVLIKEIHCMGVYSTMNIIFVNDGSRCANPFLGTALP